MRKLIVTFLLLAPALAQAGPWCYVRDEREDCNFFSSDQCYKYAATAGGSCIQNARELGSRGDARWCVVTSTYRSCIYRFKTQCLRVARLSDGGCVENVEQALFLSTTADAFGVASCRGDISCELESGLGELGDTGLGTEEIVIEPEP